MELSAIQLLSGNITNLVIAFEHCREHHLHSALRYRSPREFRRIMCNHHPKAIRFAEIEGASTP